MKGRLFNTGALHYILIIGHGNPLQASLVLQPCRSGAHIIWYQATTAQTSLPPSPFLHAFSAYRAQSHHPKSNTSLYCNIFLVGILMNLEPNKLSSSTKIQVHTYRKTKKKFWSILTTIFSFFYIQIKRAGPQAHSAQKVSFYIILWIKSN